MKRRQIAILSAVFLQFFLSFVVYGQDAQFTQYYNAPLYFNPAMTGTGMDTRVGANYRLQYPGTGSPYKNYSVWGDHNLATVNSGVGLLIRRDAVGKTGVTSTDIGGSYAYQVNINSDLAFRAGIQLGLGMRSVDYQQMVFGDQLSANGNTGSGTADPLANGAPNNKVYADVSAGGMLFSRKFYFGLSAFHLNSPNMAFTTGTVDNLPIRTSVHGGYTIDLQKSKRKDAPDRKIIPNAQLRLQGSSTQFDMGAYALWDPVLFGIAYRGIPFNKYNSDLSGNEALALIAGVHYNEFTFGYSYDLTLSGLGLSNSAGVHEISIIYEILLNPKNARKGRGMPCPNFSRRYQ